MKSFVTPPEDFNPTIQAAGCFCVWKDKLLFLKRHPQKYEGDRWGIPAGKRELGETFRMTVVREIYEEIGLHIDDDDLKDIGALYCRMPSFDYTFHMFYKRFQELPSIILGAEEHLDFQWVTPKEALALPLMVGAPEALDFYLYRSNFKS